MLRNVFFKKIGFSLLLLAVVGMAGGAWAQQLPAPNWGAGFPRLMGEKVLLMWLAVPGAESYKVYRNGEVIGTPASTNHIDQEPQGGDNRYVVSAITGGVEGDRSQEKTITIKVVEKLVVQPPTGLAARITDETIAVVWDRPKGTTLAFNVYRSEQSGTGYQMVSSVQDNKFIDQAVEIGATYYYAVTALDSDFIETAKSEELTVLFEKKIEIMAVKKKQYNLEIRATKLKLKMNLLGRETLRGAVDSAISKDGTVYVLDQVGGNVKVFDLDGNYLSSFWQTGPGIADFKMAYGMCMGPDGNIYVADTNQVFIFTPKGELVSRFKLEEPKIKEILEATTLAPENKTKDIRPWPVDVAFDSKGNLLVVDNFFGRVVVLDAKGKYITEFAQYGYGKEDYELNHPTYIGVNSRGNIAVTDTMNRRVQLYSADYKFMKSIGKAKGMVGSFLGLAGIAITKDDNFAIADPPMATIQVFDGETGDYLYHFGNEKAEVEADTKARAQWPIVNPAGISIDHKNNNIWIMMPMIQSATIRHIMD